jgi:hypothetical protein
MCTLYWNTFFCSCIEYNIIAAELEAKKFNPQGCAISMAPKGLVYGTLPSSKSTDSYQMPKLKSVDIKQITYHMQFVMPILSIHSLDLLGQGTPTNKPTLSPEVLTPEPTEQHSFKTLRRM